MPKRKLTQADNITLSEEQTTATLTLAVTNEEVDVDLHVPSGDDLVAVRKKLMGDVWKSIPDHLRAKLRSGNKAEAERAEEEYRRWQEAHPETLADQADLVFYLASVCVPVLDTRSFQLHYQNSTKEQQDAIQRKMMFLCGMPTPEDDEDAEGGKKKATRSTRSKST